jgi:hypothetical protein
MKDRTACHVATIVVLLIAWTAASSGQTQARISDVKGLQCTFSRSAAGTWRKDGTVEAAARTARLVLRFESVDTDTATARLRTGAVGSDVTIQLAQGYLHFMQAFRTGPLYTTTVFEAGASGGKFKAVHSRHEFFTTPLPGATSSPEQYYGECEAIE